MPCRDPAPAGSWFRRLVPAFALALTSWTATASSPPAATVHTIDPVHTRVVFFVGHADFARAIATASQPRGELHFDAGRWDGASVDVRLPVDRIDFGDEDWNRRMHGSRFFDARRHPEIRFVSTSVEPVDDTHARIHGDLTVAGVTQPVVLEARFNLARRNPVTFRQTVGFSATATLDRRAFGLDAHPNLIGDSVYVFIEVEAIRGSRGATSDADASAPPPGDDEDVEER